VRRIVAKELHHISVFYAEELGLGQRLAYRRLKKDYTRHVLQIDSFTAVQRMARRNVLPRVKKPWWRFW